MNSNELCWVALFILAIALILTNHLLLSAVAVVPLTEASFGDTKKAQQSEDC